MKEFNLLASAALFSQLYNSKGYNDVTDIIAEFIKDAISKQANQNLTIHDISLLLKENYEFNIPEGVIKTTVKTRLRKLYTRQDTFYIFSPSIGSNVDLDKTLSEVKDVQTLLLDSLQNYIEGRTNRRLVSSERTELMKSFYQYLLDESVPHQNSQSISAFILKNGQDLHFLKNLNLIKEGIILYQGIRFTADIHQRGKWHTDLKVFLTTEHLLNSQGLHGQIFKEIFSEFQGLVTEINDAAKVKAGDRLIQLKYLSETRDEIDGLFGVAEKIVDRKISPDYTKNAVMNIIKDCRYASEVVEKKIRFYKALEADGIFYQEYPHSLYSFKEFVVEGPEITNAVEAELKQRDWDYNGNKIQEILRMFTKINYYRGGSSKTHFENIQAILITANSLALLMGHLPSVKSTEDDIPFAKDIEFLTTKFWFKLKKGFSDTTSLPKSFDVVCKAQVILAGQISSSVGKKYESLKRDLKIGTLSQEAALQLTYALRKRAYLPEQITTENIDETLDFLNDEASYERILDMQVRGAQELAAISRQRDELLAELDEIRAQDKNRQIAADRVSFNEKRDVFVQDQLNLIIKDNNRCSRAFLGVLLLNLVLGIMATIISVDKTLKDWMAEYTWRSIVVIIFFVMIVIAEVLGRSYLFNKEKIKTGWHWIFILIRRQGLNNFKTNQRSDFEAKFGEFHKIE